MLFFVRFRSQSFGRFWPFRRYCWLSLLEYLRSRDFAPVEYSGIKQLIYNYCGFCYIEDAWWCSALCTTVPALCPLFALQSLIALFRVSPLLPIVHARYCEDLGKDKDDRYKSVIYDYVL